MAKYLYGASVQGIQDYIFATNKLQEIVGASEIVKKINEDFEKKFDDESDVEILLNAAGNIKAIFHDIEDCQKHIKEYEKGILQEACGLTLSQVVQKINEDETIEEAIKELEKKLKIQRNKPTIPIDSSLSIMKHNPRTARPAILEGRDLATQQKVEANKEFYKKNPSVKEFKEFSYISNVKNKIAIIHIDGNGLGQIVPKLNEKISSFSKKLDEATKKAVKDAKNENMHLREIIVGGDDVTVVCDADDALTFTKNFLDYFEKYTQDIDELAGITSKLTACAGIAYCNEKYPFHYAVGLAEALCGVAKNHAKREASCLMFHNIQSSNFQEWDTFVADELTIKNDKQVIRCDFGAYYLNKKNEPLIEDFINTVEAYRCEGSPINNLRNWMSELHKSEKNAQNLLHRINKVVKQKGTWKCEIMDKNLKFFHKELSNDKLLIQKNGHLKTPVYDILQILSVTTNGSKK